MDVKKYSSLLGIIGKKPEIIVKFCKERDNKEMDYYSYLEYDDFVLIFSRILKYFTGLEIQLSFTDLPNSFALSIYGNEKQIDKLAEKNEYELQLKNYGIKYQKILPIK